MAWSFASLGKAWADGNYHKGGLRSLGFWRTISFVTGRVMPQDPGYDAGLYLDGYGIVTGIGESPLFAHGAVRDGAAGDREDPAWLSGKALHFSM